MKKNYTAPEVTKMWHALSQQAYTYFGRAHHEIPPFEIVPLYTGLFGGCELKPVFGEYPSSSMAATQFDMFDRVTVKAVILNEFWMPHMYEDELINVILHELAHCMVGWEPDHNHIWARAAWELGAYDKPFLVTRSAFAGQIPWHGQNEQVYLHNHHDGPSLGYLV